MERERAKDEACSSVHHTNYDLIDVIDKIYDDFESRICENCDMFTGYSCGGSSYEFPTDKNFGCNKFEPKQ